MIYRSSGNSSLSPHNSMEGSPRMIPRQAAKFQPSPSVTPLGTKSTTSSGVSFNKKTIRNYTPQASSNMLREFEDRRNNSMDWRDKEKRGSSQPLELHSTPLGSSNRGTLIYSLSPVATSCLRMSCLPWLGKTHVVIRKSQRSEENECVNEMCERFFCN